VRVYLHVTLYGFPEHLIRDALFLEEALQGQQLGLMSWVVVLQPEQQCCEGQSIVGHRFHRTPWWSLRQAAGEVASFDFLIPIAGPRSLPKFD
jgi:hypothetical protein